MDKATANSLIANSGIHFKTTYAEFNPDDQLILEGGKTLKYTFVETIDFLNDCRVRFDACVAKDGFYSPLAFLSKNNLLEEAPNGIEVIDAAGLPRIKKDAVMALAETFSSGDPQLINISSLASLRVKADGDMITGFERLLGKWLPMPMFEVGVSGQTAGYPLGWCRVRIDRVGEPRKDGTSRFRFTWAFDTRLADDAAGGVMRPAFLPGSGDSKKYMLSNRVDTIFGGFLNIPGGNNDAPVGDYLVSLLGIDLREDVMPKYRFLAYYVYLINFLRLSGAAPEITLYNGDSRMIPVDMSVDIGNSRTCAVLFEKGDFTKARMLRLTDLTEPWRTYENAFDMRVVFRRADIGGDITFDKTLFQWPSLVRVGEEARHLFYRATEGNAESERSTSSSSPKRYLWDDRPYSSRWELMVVDDDPTNLKVNPQIFIEGFTDHFDDDGTFLQEPKPFDLFSLGQTDDQCHYSRRSLMTFVMIEMLQQATAYINSTKFRDMHGSIDARRYLRDIIVTCPTAMPLAEQRALRRAAADAASLLRKLDPSLPEITITPDPDTLVAGSDGDTNSGGWLYDEAFASQFVYLYAELAERYRGKIEDFFRIKGHHRPEMERYGFQGNALTIGTIDIGAGTTDIMLTAYGRTGNGRITPVPLFYDSFYTAGDDIIHNIIRDIVLESADRGSETLGSISSSLALRLAAMTPDRIAAIGRVAESRQLQDAVTDIRHAASEEEVANRKAHLTHELMNNFFADNSANQSERDRRSRLDFCTQVSQQIAQFFLELLKQGRPSKIYTYDEIFPREKPSPHLLDYFEWSFGFRFEELSWRFDPEEVGRIVCETMEPLMKALSVVMYAHHCDILVLSGRPTNLDPLTDLFLKYMPIAPSRLVLLNRYHVGRWFPLATEEGYFQESQKAVVAVGAEVGHLASTVGFHGLVLDFSKIADIMKPTSCFMGAYDSYSLEVRDPFLSPKKSAAMLRDISVFPFFIGTKQFDSPRYQGRPLYAIYNNSGRTPLNITIQRDYFTDRETLVIEETTDREGETIPAGEVELRLQTLGNDGNFWMDKGAFTLKIQHN